MEAEFNASVEALPDGWIKVKLFWSQYTLDIVTNSTVLGVNFDSKNRSLDINVGGPDGTLGVCNITVPKVIVSSISDIEVYLDDQPLEFTLIEYSESYFISIKYQHSTHKLSVNFARHFSVEKLAYLFPFIVGVMVGVALTLIITTIKWRKRLN